MFCSHMKLVLVFFYVCVARVWIIPNLWMLHVGGCVTESVFHCWTTGLRGAGVGGWLVECCLWEAAKSALRSVSLWVVWMFVCTHEENILRWHLYLIPLSCDLVSMAWLIAGMCFWQVITCHHMSSHVKFRSTS